MLSKEKKLFEELREIIKEMNEEVDVVIVEGVKDRNALRKLGFKKDIINYREKGRFELLEKVKEKYQRVVVLTDFDRQGKKYNKEISDFLKNRVDKRYREKIGKILCSNGRRDIESINNLIKKFG